jgi:Glycosyl transferases group 1
MRILLSCLQSPKRHPIPAYEFWRSYFVAGLQEAGHEVLEVPAVDWVEGIVIGSGAELGAWRARTWQKVHEFAARESAQRPIDLFLGYLFPSQVDVAAIGELQRRGIPCVNFFCDTVREFRSVPPEFRPFALHWLPDYEGLRIYRTAGLACMQAPYPCWVAPQFRSPPAAETEPATFIGSMDVMRRAFLGEALEGGADFVLRGAGWLVEDDDAVSRPARPFRSVLANQLALFRKQGLYGLLIKIANRLHPLPTPSIPQSRVRTAPSPAEYIRISREAKVTIGMNRVPSARTPNWRPLSFVRLRDIEAPMLGACYLTEWTESLPHLYEIGVDIETFQTPDELAAKLTELDRHPGRRAEMRRRAQHRALNEHNLARSIARIGQRLGLAPA